MVQRVYLFSGHRFRSLLQENFENIDFLENFKISKTCKIALEGYVKVYIKNVGFLCNKKLCIISQYNILITKFNIFRFGFFHFYFIKNLTFQLRCVGRSLTCLNNTPTAVVLSGLYDFL